MKQTLCSILIGAVLSAPVTVVPAQARDGFSPGAAAAAGLLGGLAIGGAIGAAQSNSYYPGKPVYVAPPPRRVYVEEPDCHVERRRYVDEFGDVIIRRVRVCD